MSSVALRSFLMSFLVREYLVAKSTFARKYPGAWLVWEPGDWKAPRNKAATTEVVRSRVQEPRAGDALCFQLGSTGERRSQLTVGRDDSCQVVLNDATVSRVHLSLEGSLEEWAAAAVDPEKQVLLDGAKLQVISTPLSPGASLQLGGVSLTFLDSAALVNRVAALGG